MDFQNRKSKIINHIKVVGCITSGDVQKITGVHRNTALKDFKQLLDEKIVQSFGEGRGT